MSYSLRYVFGINGSKCDRTAKLLEQRSIAASQIDEDSEDSDSMGSDTDGGSESNGSEPLDESRVRRFNRDDVALAEWRRLAGIQ
ncbi:MAG: hypothetical protein EBZ48_04195 [Proteobacteria bacterium]|nr:hypothetical protein [Pseudomonadota bacterium]